MTFLLKSALKELLTSVRSSRCLWHTLTSTFRRRLRLRRPQKRPFPCNIPGPSSCRMLSRCSRASSPLRRGVKSGRKLKESVWAAAHVSQNTTGKEYGVCARRARWQKTPTAAACGPATKWLPANIVEEYLWGGRDGKRPDECWISFFTVSFLWWSFDN